jgi:hypothetical protein
MRRTNIRPPFLDLGTEGLELDTVVLLIIVSVLEQQRDDWWTVRNRESWWGLRTISVPYTEIPEDHLQILGNRGVFQAHTTAQSHRGGVRA